MRSSCLHRIRGCGNHSCMTECVRYYPKAEPWRHDKGFHKCRKLGYQPVKTAGNVVFPVWAHQCAAGRMSAEASWRRTSGTSSTDKKLVWSRGFRQVDARKKRSVDQIGPHRATVRTQIHPHTWVCIEIAVANDNNSRPTRIRSESCVFFYAGQTVKKF